MLDQPRLNCFPRHYDVGYLLIVLLSSTILAAMLLLSSALQPLTLLSGGPLLAAGSILCTLASNALCIVSIVLPGLSAYQRMAILTMVHAVVLNTVPLCCRGMMPMWLLRACVAIPALVSTVAGHLVLAGVASAAPTMLMPHVLTVGVLPLLLSMDLITQYDVQYAKSSKSD